MAKTVFVAGNPAVREDSIALGVAKELKGIEFREIESLGEIEELPEELVLLDAAKGIEKVEVIENLDALERERKVSLHDFDIGTELLLYRKLGKLKKVKIVAIPIGYKMEKAVEEVRAILL